MDFIDFRPLFRSSIGFDNLIRALAETAAPSPTYPPYNISKTGEDTYRLTVAVAGFKSEDIEITAQDGKLTIKGRAEQDNDSDKILHRGIASRPFERQFHLADYMTVGEALLENGLLSVELTRVVPESLKPRRINISAKTA